MPGLFCVVLKCSNVFLTAGHAVEKASRMFCNAGNSGQGGDRRSGVLESGSWNAIGKLTLSTV